MKYKIIYFKNLIVILNNYNIKKLNKFLNNNLIMKINL